MAKSIKAQATSVITTRWTVLTSEALYFLTVYNLGPVLMWSKELASYKVLPV